MTGELIGRLTFLALLPCLAMGLIGGLYYLSARPRLTFRQAMFRWWVVLAGFTILLVGVCGQLALKV